MGLQQPEGGCDTICKSTSCGRNQADVCVVGFDRVGWNSMVYARTSSVRDGTVWRSKVYLKGVYAMKREHAVGMPES